MGADTTASLGIEVTVKGAQQASQDLDKLNQSQKNVAQGTKDLNAAQQQGATGVTAAAAAQATLATSATATGQSMSLFQRVMSGIGGLFGPYGNAANSVSASMTGLAGAHGEAAKAMHLVETAAYSAGTNLGGLGQFAILARGGLILLAAGITAGVIVALEKAADATNTVKERLAALLGDGAGKNAFDKLKASTDAANNSLNSYLEGIEALTRAQAGQSNFKTVDANPGGGFSVSSGLPGADISSAAKVISQALQIDKDTAAEAANSINTYFLAVAKAGAFTSDVYKQIEHDSPTLAAAISQAWGGDGSLKAQAELEAQLQKTPKTIDQFLQTLNQLAPQFQAAYAKMAPNISQDIDILKTKLIELSDTMATTAKVSGASGFLSSAIASVKQMNSEIEKGIGFWKALSDALSPPDNEKQFNDYVNNMANDIRTLLGLPKVNIVVDAPIENLKEVKKAADDATQSLTFLQRAGASFQLGSDKGPGGINIGTDIEKVKSEWIGLYNLFDSKTFSPSGNLDNLKNGLDQLAAKIRDTDQLSHSGNHSFDGINAAADNSVVKVGQDVNAIVSSVLGGIGRMQQAATQVGQGTSGSGPSFDASNITDVNAGQSFEGFASGGIARVVGPSGTDKTLVQFMATSGEVIAVGNPSAANAGGSTGVSVSAITSPITAAVNSSTGQIVAAINKQVTNYTGLNGTSGTGGGGVSLKLSPSALANNKGFMDTGQAAYDAWQPGPPSPTDPPIQDYSVFDPQIADPTGGSASTYAFATGFNGYVGGSGGPDSKRINMNVTPGELISVKPPGSKQGEDTRPIHQHFYMMAPNGPGSFPSPAQIKRAMQQSIR